MGTYVVLGISLFGLVLLARVLKRGMRLWFRLFLLGVVVLTLALHVQDVAQVLHSLHF